ncbi:MAG: hypothetical protein ACPG80_05840, partial [Rickettsiales bacterium]
MPSPEQRSNKQPPLNTQQQRVADASRVAKFGMLLGLVAGMFTGGGLIGAVKMAGVFAAAGGVLGAVAGEKINPVLDKISGVVRRRKQPEAVAEEQVEENARGRGQECQREASLEETIVSPATCSPVSAVDAAMLEQAANATRGSVDKAWEGASKEDRQVAEP